jgi:hypothetical protein
MKKMSFALILLAGFLSCTDKNKLPDDVLPQRKMQAVMWDMIRAGDFLNNYVLYRDTTIDKIAESQKWHEKVFSIHQITREQFDKSYAYYRTHPQLMKAVMDSISKIKVETPPVPVAAPLSSPDSLKKRLDSLKQVRKVSRLGRFGKRLPQVTQ